MSDHASAFSAAAERIINDVADHGDETGRAVPAAIAMLMAHDMAQTSATIEALLQADITRLKEALAAMCDERDYWRDVAQMGVTPRLYHRLGLDRKPSDAA